MGGAFILAGVVVSALWLFLSPDDRQAEHVPLSEAECEKALNELPPEWQARIMDAAKQDHTTEDTSFPSLRAEVSNLRDAGYAEAGDCLSRVIDLLPGIISEQEGV